MKTSFMFLLGMGLGTVLGILVAPEAGKITRRKIRDEADRIIDETLQRRKLQAAINRLEATPEPDEEAVVARHSFATKTR